MNVGELMAQLEGLDPETPVVVRHCDHCNLFDHVGKARLVAIGIHRNREFTFEKFFLKPGVAGWRLALMLTMGKRP